MLRLIALVFAASAAGALQAQPLDAAAATHTAVADGDWFNAATWDNGVPGDGALALVPAGRELVYAGVSAEVLDGVLVMGRLAFDPDTHSELVLDTLQVGHGGELEIGTEARPIAAQASVRIRFPATSDLDPATDPAMLRRGLVAHGRVRINGEARTVHGKVAVDPMAGQSQLQMAEAPRNWRVGDTLVLAGTRYSGWKWDNDLGQVTYHGSQDEVLTITAIDGAQVSFQPALAHDHATPRADLKASVANFSRNVSFETIDGETAPPHRRAHVMFHDPDVDVRYAAFHQLGRTDKSVPSTELAELAVVAADSNVRGRYAFHLHRIGIDDPDNPVIVIGNAVFNSPGWGYVHHDSNAIFHDNASFDTHGAGFIAETGNEIGAWTSNIAIRAEGNSAFNPKNGNDTEAFDMARSGAGFWFQGRMVRSVGNVAASVNHGYVYLHRGPGMLGFPSTAFSLPEALRRSGNAAPDDAPILNFHDNEAFASTVGLYVVKANPNQQHDVHSHFSDFLAWEVRAGAAMEYTSHYLLEDFDIVGSTPEPFRDPAFGIEFGTNTSDMVVHRAQIAGMATGLVLAKDFTDPVPPEVNQYVLVDVALDNVGQAYEHFDPLLDTVLTGEQLVPGRFEVAINGGAPLDYLSPATSAGSGVDYAGTKTDSIGVSPIPAGTDAIGTPSYDMIAICETDGYYRSDGGVPYAVVEEFFTDRATGEVHKFGLVTRLGPDVDALLGSEFHAWRNAFQRGVIDLASVPPLARDDRTRGNPGVDLVIDVLANDSDPDGDPLVVDGVVQPDHGRVTVEPDGRLRYRPDFDYEGQDRFKYWAYDDNGHYAGAWVQVGVESDYLFADGFDR